MSQRLAHTAEHAFIGALQKIMQKTLFVRKVEHNGSQNSAFIVDKELTLDKVLEAERLVNALIAKGARITEREFSSLDEAKIAIPSLRSNDKRISGKVRVVEIENHDLAACSMEHATDLKECDFFLVTGFGRSANELHVEFAVGEGAKQEARRFSSILLAVCSELGANTNTIENTVKKLKLQNRESVSRLKEMTKEQMSRTGRDQVGDIQLVHGVHSNLDDAQVVESAWSLVKSGPVMLVIVNALGENAQFVLARNEQVSGPDFSKMVSLCPGRPRGGGRAHFVTGIIDSNMAEPFVDFAVSAIRRELRVG